MGAAESTDSYNYPRPDFKPVTEWQSLNGKWNFRFDDDDCGLRERWHLDGVPPVLGEGEHADGRQESATRLIEVPYVFQAPASGIHAKGVHQVLWYERQITDICLKNPRTQAHRLILRFGAVDYEATVWLDGHFVGEHRGGHVPFDIDLTDVLRLDSSSETHRLAVRVFDSASDLTQPRGKQYWNPEPESIFYTPSSGIWQNVWLEIRAPAYIADSSYGTVLRSNDIDRGVLDARVAIKGRRVGRPYAVEIEASFAGIVFNTERRDLPHDSDTVQMDVHLALSEEVKSELPPLLLMHAPLGDDRFWRNDVALWAPEHPLLYDIKIRLYDLGPQDPYDGAEDGEPESSGDRPIDTIHTSTGMRALRWDAGDGTFRLNDQPYFHALVLDQGYWPETLMTPPSPEALRRDIELSKAMGFNGCRKHQKVEDPVFLYWADKLGFMVWGEMANTYAFDPVTGTRRFDEEWAAAVRRDLNHPSVVAWTPVNESWGYPDLHDDLAQRAHLRALYHATKALDPTRPVNDNCGWEHVATDLTTFHDYADAGGMGERCATLKELLGRGRAMFLPPVYDPKNHHVVLDPGSSHRPGAPVLCTEFGGVNIAPPGEGSGDGDRKSNWGYTTASDGADLLRRVEDLVMRTVESGVCCGIVWTQLTDIEQEQNGLYAWDRTEKLPAAEVKAIMERAERTYLEKRGGRR